MQFKYQNFKINTYHIILTGLEDVEGTNVCKFVDPFSTQERHRWLDAVPWISVVECGKVKLLENQSRKSSKSSNSSKSSKLSESSKSSKSTK